MSSKPVLICELPHKNSEYYPTKEGVFVEKDLKIYLCKPEEKPLLFCEVDNLTWQANDFGVYFKNTKDNQIILVEKSGGKRKVICKTKNYFWTPHNKGGVFVFDDRLGILTHFGESQPLICNDEEKAWFKKVTDFISPKKRMFDDDQFVSLCNTRLFYPYEDGYFFCRSNNIYFYSSKKRSETFIASEPVSSHGRWNAHYGQVYKSIGRSIFFCSELLNISFKMCDSDFVSFKGAEHGAVVCKNFNELWYYAKPKNLRGISSVGI